ncbi:PREDICTED: uncharacterized protein LOC108494489 [Lepidothrix coronata]|uniref:Uncharacterized protein LOC108494489 n=1 Tax=Lepidothrix coronata TaxID=321398 RepID=A0A6J0GRB0_9PASS|nr:PREDICTED: uncharacterized protein LOC108494489 [Lepidothrix coronata]
MAAAGRGHGAGARAASAGASAALSPLIPLSSAPSPLSPFPSPIPPQPHLPSALSPLSPISPHPTPFSPISPQLFPWGSDCNYWWKQAGVILDVYTEGSTSWYKGKSFPLSPLQATLGNAPANLSLPQSLPSLTDGSSTGSQSFCSITGAEVPLAVKEVDTNRKHPILHPGRRLQCVISPVGPGGGVATLEKRVQIFENYQRMSKSPEKWWRLKGAHGSPPLLTVGSEREGCPSSCPVGFEYLQRLTPQLLWATCTSVGPPSH